MHVVEGEFSTQWMQQSCMGTAGCVAEFDMNRNLTIWAKTQIPFLAQRDFNDMLAGIGLKGKSCRVVVPAIGGAFGTGLDTHAYEYIAILLALRTSKPVKIVCSALWNCTRVIFWQISTYMTTGISTIGSYSKKKFTSAESRLPCAN